MMIRSIPYKCSLPTTIPATKFPRAATAFPWNMRQQRIYTIGKDIVAKSCKNTLILLVKNWLEYDFFSITCLVQFIHAVNHRQDKTKQDKTGKPGF